MTTDTSEKGLETLIVRHMTGTDGLSVAPNMVARPPLPYGGTGYTAGSALDYDRAHALDVAQLFAFLRATQPEAFKKLAMADPNDTKNINRIKFLTRLSTECGSKRGVIDVLRKGIEHHPAGHFDLFYGTPSPGNAKAEALHAQNRFSITRQLAYSMDETRRALDLGLFINGLPIATFELKNSLTKQTVEDAVEQYRRDRDPRERLFEFGRCVVHFAVDDSEVRMCTELARSSTTRFKGPSNNSCRWVRPWAMRNIRATCASSLNKARRSSSRRCRSSRSSSTRSRSMPARPSPSSSTKRIRARAARLRRR